MVFSAPKSSTSNSSFSSIFFFLPTKKDFSTNTGELLLSVGWFYVLPCILFLNMTVCLWKWCAEICNFLIKKGVVVFGGIISKFILNDGAVTSTLVSTEIRVASTQTDSYMNYFCKKGFNIAYYRFD